MITCFVLSLFEGALPGDSQISRKHVKIVTLQGFHSFNQVLSQNRKNRVIFNLAKKFPKILDFLQAFREISDYNIRLKWKMLCDSTKHQNLFKFKNWLIVTFQTSLRPKPRWGSFWGIWIRCCWWGATEWGNFFRNQLGKRLGRWIRFGVRSKNSERPISRESRQPIRSHPNTGRDWLPYQKQGDFL